MRDLPAKKLPLRWFVFAVAVLPFIGSLASGFHLDDYAIFQDAGIRAADGWWKLWSLRQTRPLTFFTFWLNYRLGGENPVGYHALNLALHGAAALLLYACLRRVAKREALFAALIFAAHPLQAEAVDYVWARSIVLAALLTFAAWREWIDGREWRAVAWFALALLAKEECVAFPLALMLTPRSLGAGAAGARAGGDVRPLRSGGGAGVLCARAYAGRAAGSQAGISPWHYFLAQGAVMWRYLNLLLVPYGFTVDPQIAVPPVWLGMVCWIALATVAAFFWRRARWFAAGLILLLPSSSIFPAEDLAADRRMYLAMAAFAVVAAQLLVKRRWAAIAVTLTLAALSAGRTYVWMSDERLWREAVERAPEKVRPKIQLARVAPAPEALALLEDARRLAPADANVAAQTGKLLLSQGNAAAALSEFGRALALDPRDAVNYNNRGVALAALGKPGRRDAISNARWRWIRGSRKPAGTWSGWRETSIKLRRWCSGWRSPCCFGLWQRARRIPARPEECERPKGRQRPELRAATSRW